MLKAQKLHCKDDEHKWVERKAIESDHSRGWISTRRSLEAQGHNQGNRKLWLQKPEFIAYKVPSTMDPSTTDAERRQQRTQQQRRRKRRSKPQRRRQPIGRPIEYAQTWIPKESISHISAKGKRHHLVWILAKGEESKVYQK